MPWQEVKPMEQRVLFIADYLRGGAGSFKRLCEAYGISRKTGYKWVARFKSEGVEGLNEKSRRPSSHAGEIPYAIQQKIITLRQRFRTAPGPKKIAVLLEKELPNEVIPSTSSIHNILKRAGLIDARKIKRRVMPYKDPFKPVTKPNQLWSVDFKGQFKLGNGHWCYPLTVMDHQSRFLMGCQGLRSTDTAGTQKTFEQLFRGYGLPDRIRSDNGVPFASRSAGGLSRLSIWWLKLGILPERILPGKPQQNGQHERMHRTLKKAVTKPVSHSLSAQQKQLDEFQYEYNEERPHESLQQKTPSELYSPSSREYPSTLKEMTYPDYFLTLKVRSSGVLYWSNGQIYVSNLLKGEYVGMEEVDDGIWDIYFGPIRLGGFDQRRKLGNDTPYWTLKV